MFCDEENMLVKLEGTRLIGKNKVRR